MAYTATASSAALAYKQGHAPLAKGDVVKIVKNFFRRGEGWVKLDDGREFPDVAFL